MGRFYGEPTSGPARPGPVSSIAARDRPTVENRERTEGTAEAMAARPAGDVTRWAGVAAAASACATRPRSRPARGAATLTGRVLSSRD